MEKSSTAAYTTILILLSMIWIWDSEVIGADQKAGGTKAAEAKIVVQKVTEIKTAPPYRYNPVGKPDPFKPFIDRELAVLKKAKPLPMSPLQRASISEFKLVGISGDDKTRKAVVQDVKGKVYPIFIGTYIGLNHGRVAEIRADRVIVEEKAESSARKKTKANRITIKLRREEGEEKP